MEYWNVAVRNIRSGKLADLGLDEVGAWTRVSSFCVDQENQGLIKSARTWSETKWLQTTGVPREMILRCTELFEWEGDDLRVWMYPVSQEEVCQEKRRIAAAAGVASGIARRKLAEERKAKELESACDKERTAERPFNGSSEVVEQKRKEIGIERETGRVKEKESKTETQTPQPAQGQPPIPAKPAGATPLSVSVSNFSQIQNQTLNQTPAPSSPPAEKDAAWFAGFEEFWTNYPRKDARRKAEQAWRNVKGKERPRLVELMQALGRQSSCPAWREQDGRFIPLPATWINGRRWEDGGTSAAAPVQQTAPLLPSSPVPLPMSSPFGVKDADGLSPLQRALAQSQSSASPVPALALEVATDWTSQTRGGLPW
ncbi:hypothetical protein [Verrucomicrobium sp. BvORR106]|uniref:hypothetical protein n=1 Tax=Verrucomicrobium sp. BvORR106 TaxID=1403819 RepID=UPI000690FD8E|nr:hypothetical protein [Verrucomicrobium sp. BvORR106]